MQYRKIKKLGISTSLFGVGCMRFPMIKNEAWEDVVDEAVSTPAIRHAIESGVNYFDTAYVYSGGRKNEIALGHALRDGYREKVYIATKLPISRCNSREEMEQTLREQLEDLETDYIDFYLLHALNGADWDRAKELGVIEFLEDAKAAGKIKYICFSFHDNYDAFKKIIDGYDWDMCQIQYNFIDVNNQATEKGLRYAGEKGIPVVIMEGLLGGKLASAPSNVQELYDSFPTKRSPVEWSFRWICNYPEVAVVLSGVTNRDMCDENIKIFDRCLPGCMTEDELSLIDRVRDAYNRRIKVSCTACRYCMPCPGGVDIPAIFSTWNNASMYSENISGNGRYKRITEKQADASKCLECGVCQTKCPQNIEIIDMLKAADCELK